MIPGHCHRTAACRTQLRFCPFWWQPHFKVPAMCFGRRHVQMQCLTWNLPLRWTGAPCLVVGFFFGDVHVYDHSPLLFWVGLSASVFYKRVPRTVYCEEMQKVPEATLPVAPGGTRWHQLFLYVVFFKFCVRFGVAGTVLGRHCEKQSSCELCVPPTCGREMRTKKRRLPRRVVNN